MSMTAVPISILRRARADGREQRERRAELAGEVMHAEVGAVGAELLGGDGQLDRLQQRVRRRAHLRLRRRRPVPERQEPDLFHEPISIPGLRTRAHVVAEELEALERDRLRGAGQVAPDRRGRRQLTQREAEALMVSQRS